MLRGSAVILLVGSLSVHRIISNDLKSCKINAIEMQSKIGMMDGEFILTFLTHHNRARVRGKIKGALDILGFYLPFAICHIEQGNFK